MGGGSGGGKGEGGSRLQIGSRETPLHMLKVRLLMSIKQVSPAVRPAHSVLGKHATVPRHWDVQVGLTRTQVTWLGQLPTQLAPASLVASRLDTHDEDGQMPVDRQQWWKQLASKSQEVVGLVEPQVAGGAVTKGMQGLVGGEGGGYGVGGGEGRLWTGGGRVVLGGDRSGLGGGGAGRGGGGDGGA